MSPDAFGLGAMATSASRSVFPLPLTIGEIDDAWLTAALRTRAPGITVRHCQIDDVFHATSSSIRIRLELDEAGERAGIPRTIYVKGGFQEHSRTLAPMHKLETLGYRDLLGDGALNAPACYFADWDEERQQGIVIMEDLTARGGRFGHLRITRNVDEVAQGVAQLARYHARTWDIPALAPQHPLGWMRQTPILETEAYRHCMTTEEHARYMVMPRAGAASTYFKDREWIIDSTARLGRLSARVGNCILHGDPNPGNIFFQDDGGVAFFDIVPRRGPALLEVAYHVTLSLDPCDRPRHEHDLVRLYLGELAALGIAAPGFDDAMFQYGAFLAEALIMCMFNPPGVIPEDMAVIPVARLSAAMVAHDTRSLLARIA